MQISKIIMPVCLTIVSLLNAQPSDHNPFEGMPANQIVAQLSYAVHAQDVNQIALALVGLPIDTIEQVLIALIQEKTSSLSDIDKISLWILTAYAHAHNTEYQQKILNLYGNKALQDLNVPILLTAARNNQADLLIPMLVQWIKGDNRNKSTLSKKMRKAIMQLPLHSMRAAIAANDINSLQRLIERGVSLTADQATILLWAIVDENKRQNTVPAFVSLVAQQGANMNAHRKGYTPLIKAVEMNNERLVRALVDAGASVNAMPSTSVGSALQMAIEKGYSSLDEFLREHGARERKAKSK